MKAHRAIDVVPSMHDAKEQGSYPVSGDLRVILESCLEVQDVQFVG